MDFQYLLSSFSSFINKGYNLYYIIGAAVIVVLAVVILAAAINAKKKKNRQIVAEEKQASYIAPKTEETASDDKETLTKVVPVVPVAKKEKTVTEPSASAEKVAVPLESKKAEASKKEEVNASTEEKDSTVAAVAEDESKAEGEIRLKRPGFIQIYKDNSEKFRFRMKASNNETVGHSQGYTTKASCKNGIKAVQAIASDAEIADTTREDYKVTIGIPSFEVYKDNENKFRFRLRAANTNNILASQGYTTKDNCLNGIRSIRHIAENFSLVDDTVKAKAEKAEEKE